jgi:lipopolysaccharide transport system ATP-binding protein
MNVKCFEAFLSSVRDTFASFADRGSFRCHLPKVPLLPGRYYINVGLYPTNWNYVYDYHWQMHTLHVVPTNGKPLDASGLVCMNPSWSVLTSRSTNAARGMDVA